MKLKGQDLIKGNISSIPQQNTKQILSTSTIQLKFNFDFTEVQSLLFQVILNCIVAKDDNEILSYEYKEDEQGIKIQVKADDRYNFLLLTKQGELVWAIYTGDENMWTKQFKSWEDNADLEGFINSFINQNK